MNARRLAPLLTALFTCSLLCLTLCEHATAGTPLTDRIAVWDSGYWYLLGWNYPWLNYGHDFGTTAWGHDGASAEASRPQIDADFAYLKSQGVHVVRWFLFCDCRAAPEFDANGYATGFDEHFYADLDAAVAVAHKYEIYLIPVLLDYLLADAAQLVNGVQLFGRSEVISDSGKRQAFLDNALRPLLERYGQDRNIIAWDVMNEPEGATTVPDPNWVGEPVNVRTMQSFVGDVVGYIHTYTSQYATLGSASWPWLLDYWTGSNLDFYQYHHYDSAASIPLYADLNLDKPCIVGEFPTKNAPSTLTQYLDTIWNNGYAGALPWSYRAGDGYSDFSSVADDFNDWSQAHDEDVDIRVKYPVYRFWSPVHSRHFYTAGPSEKRKLIEKYSHVWTYEGTAYYAWSDDGEPNSLPVYRFWSDILSAHFYTINESEKDKLVNNYPDVWTYEGVAFYAFHQGLQPLDASPLYRFWSHKLGCHFYTMSERERDKLMDQYSHVWTYEGIAWYAYES